MTDQRGPDWTPTDETLLMLRAETLVGIRDRVCKRFDFDPKGNLLWPSPVDQRALDAYGYECAKNIDNDRIRAITAETAAQHALRAAEAEVAALRELLLVAVDYDECRFDHHGFCQTHWLEKPCSMEVIRAGLARTESGGQS